MGSCNLITILNLIEYKVKASYTNRFSQSVAFGSIDYFTTSKRTKRCGFNTRGSQST